MNRVAVLPPADAGTAYYLRAHWRLWAALSALLGVAYWWTASWMVIRWEATNSYYSHGWLIVPVSAFLVWSRRRELAALPIEPSRWGLPLLGAGLLFHLVSMAWRIGFTSGFSLPLVLAGLVLTFLGAAFLRRLAFPIAFLVFMVPIPDVTVQALSFQSKMLAARMSAFLAHGLGVAVVHEGSYMKLLNGNLIVDDVCSGLKYMISLAAFGALYAYISSLRWQGKTLIVLLTIPVAFTANVVRVTLMTLIADRWGTEAAGRAYVHDLLGFLLFIVAFVLFFFIESLLLFLPRHEPEAAAAEEEGEEE